MPNVERRGTRISLYRAFIIGAGALALIAVSFHGELDRFAQGEVADTTGQSMGIYVVSRAINGLVSVLQTSQIKVPLLASAEVGQMLDPINDAVERLSSVLVWAVGSLFVQRILLEIVASSVFKWVLCSIGAAMTVLLLLIEWGRFRLGCRQVLSVSDSTLERFRDWLVRLFVVLAIARFIVPAFIALSFLVSQMFLESGIGKNTEQLSLLRTQVSDIASSPTPDVGQLEEEKAGVKAKMKTLQASYAADRQEIERLDDRIAEHNREAGFRQLLPSSLGGVSDGDEVRAAKERHQTLVRNIQRTEDAIREAEDDLECIDTRLAGGSCDSLWERVSSAGKTGISRLKETFGKLNDMATNVAMLLVAIAIKNILFPILFLMVAVKCSLPIARHASRLLAGFEKDSRKLKETIASHANSQGQQLERSES